MLFHSGPGNAAEYNRVISFLHSFDRFGILLGLENVRSLLEALRNPQEKLKVVHIAGSNGKGSTASYINSVAMAAGLKTGLYTSPHLNDFRERIRINGCMVSRQDIIDSAAQVQRVYDPERTTFFEYTTAMAFLIMEANNLDLAVIEVGLGGRLDATNVVDPMVTVITDISREHEDYLGFGISSVAKEKAGIIKPGVPLITGASRKDARLVITDIAHSLGAPTKEFGREFLGKPSGLGSMSYKSSSMELRNLKLGMFGSHQVKNAALALATIEELILKGYPIGEEAMRSGLGTTRFPGRFEILAKKPDVIIDGAHTPEGMRLLKSTLQRLYPCKKPLLLLGMLKDKNYDILVRTICPTAGFVVCVEPQSDRALAAGDLAQIIRGLGVPAEHASNVREGYGLLRSRAAAEDVIVATGSLYMIGEVRRACGIDDDQLSPISEFSEI
jgi:dihydrofolate synthase / folylpolyglutamate synthase